MKIGGQEAKKGGLFGPLTFKRDDETFYPFFATPVHNLDEFNRLCPVPEVTSGMFTPTGWVKDPESPAHKAALANRGEIRWAYICVKSLEPSNIEWDTVVLDDPSTWINYEDDLLSVLSYLEFAKVQGLIEEANALDEAKLEENTASFFRQMAAKNAEQPPENPSPNSAPESTPDSESANDGG